MSKIDDYLDDTIHHAILFERYKTGQANKILRYVRSTNRQIADYVKSHSFETKKQYKAGSLRAREYIKEMVETLRRIIRKDLVSLITVEKEIIAEISPVELDTDINENRVLNDIMFAAFSKTDTINSYLQGLGERIFKVWDAQFRVAYMTGMDSRKIIEAVLG